MQRTVLAELGVRFASTRMMASMLDSVSCSVAASFGEHAPSTQSWNVAAATARAQPLPALFAGKSSVRVAASQHLCRRIHGVRAANTLRKKALHHASGHQNIGSESSIEPDQTGLPAVEAEAPPSASSSRTAAWARMCKRTAAERRTAARAL